MFTGIVETVAIIEKIDIAGTNRTFTLSSKIAGELSVDQSLSHNGTCLTVEKVFPGKNTYQVTAIQETLDKTMFGRAKVGDKINLERSLKADSRLDGHFVQGHVDTRGEVFEIKEYEGSWEYFIRYEGVFEDLIVPKGSICVNGISLTVAKNNENEHWFSVAIIPYTHEITNIGDWKISDLVNIEFDILGKYVKKIMSQKND